MKHQRVVLAGLLLTVITLVIYWPLTGHQFISIDDHDYISQNSHVTSGLTWPGVKWAFCRAQAGNWHPLTWMSHMLDCQLFGLNPGRHHLVNAFFHALNSLLLLLVLRQMTGAFWRSALVAALFAWHPLHVESVAWASERKDVLSAFFFMLTLWAYTRYWEGRRQKAEGRSNQRPVISGQKSENIPHSALRTPHSEHALRSTLHVPHALCRWYILALGFFTLGLMSKPMLVTLPFLLLALDFWPLRRFELKPENAPRSLPSMIPVPLGSLAGLAREKLPFFALSLIASLVTYQVQQGAISSFQALPLSTRLINAVVSYGRYLAKTIWPADLAAIYPYEMHLPLGLIVGAGLLLFGLTLVCCSLARRFPFLIVGWLWFLGTLVPTIGLVQVGSQSMADRYMYIPAIGLFVMAVWGVGALAQREAGSGSAKLQPSFAVVTGGILITLLSCTSAQLSYWRDSETVFRHAAKVTDANYIALDRLGAACGESGKEQEALTLCAEAVRLQPDYAVAHYDLGTILLKSGRLEEAKEQLRLAAQQNPALADAQMNLGKVFLCQGKLEDAAAHFGKAIELAREDPQAHYALGTVRLRQSKLDEAVAGFANALRLQPDFAEAHSNLGIALVRQGKLVEAAKHFLIVAELSPQDPQAHKNLGTTLLQLGQAAQAEACFAQTLRLEPNEWAARYNRVVAIARQQRLNEATSEAQNLLSRAVAAGQTEMAAKTERLLKSCQNGQPLQEPL